MQRRVPVPHALLLVQCYLGYPAPPSSKEFVLHQSSGSKRKAGGGTDGHAVGKAAQEGGKEEVLGSLSP